MEATPSLRNTQASIAELPAYANATLGPKLLNPPVHFGLKLRAPALRVVPHHPRAWREPKKPGVRTAT